MDETFVRIAGRWMYLFRAVDSGGQTVDFYLSETRDREAAKCFLKPALANHDNRAPHVFARNRRRSYPAAIRELQNEGNSVVAVGIEPGAIRTTASNPTTATSNGACAACMAPGP
jgi:IS6 family transposase